MGLIILITLGVYAPVLHGGFVFDDYELITGNQIVHARDGLYRFWFTTEAPDYYPLTWSLWWMEWRLWGASPMGYHVVNVLLHAINSILVWIILCRLKIPGAWLAALVFAIHPVNVATVAWISEQKNTLSMLFYATAILFYLRFEEEGRWGWYGLSLAAFLLALLSKTAVVMLPVVLLGCVWWLRSRVRWKDFALVGPFVALSLLLGLATIWLQFNRVWRGSAVQTDGFLGRLAIAGYAPWYYLSKALLPVNLTVIYPKWAINGAHWSSYVPGVILVGGLALFWLKRNTWGRPLLFGFGYFVATLFPVLGFFDQTFLYSTFVADHWQYYSIIAPIVLVVVAGDWAGRRLSEQHRHWGVMFGVVVLMMLGVAAWARSAVYVDQETLWRDNLAKNPAAWLAEYNLGAALTERGETEEAIKHYEQALRINPEYAVAHNNLGNALSRMGRIDDAIEHFQQALRIRPDFAEAHYNFGVALAQRGSMGEAIEHWEQAVRMKPDYAVAHYNLGTALIQVGKRQEAIDHLEQALRIKPDYILAHYNLGVVLEQTGRIQEAIGHYEQALRIKADFVMARDRLGRLRDGP